MDAERKPVKTWQFRRAFPVKWSGPALNAQQGAVAIESVELVHEGLELMT
jgi:phage tail-like protein